MIIGQTVVGGTVTLNPQFLPEFLVIGSVSNVTGNNAPTSLNVTIDGTPRISIPSAALVRAFGAFGGLWATGVAAGGTRDLAIYRIANGGLGQRNITIQISQGAGGAAQNVYGFTTSKNDGTVVTAKVQTIVANSSMTFDTFDCLFVDGALSERTLNFKSGWTETILQDELNAINSLLRVMETEGATIGGLAEVYYNRYQTYSSVKLETGANARVVMRIGRATL